MKNNKGFTLVELLGVIVILSIIMLIAIPNVSSMLERNKRDQYITDAKKMVTIVQYDIRKGEVDKPAAGELVKVTLKELSTGDLETDADGVSYDEDNSYVVIVRKNGYLVYYVNLVTKNSDGTYKGIYLTNVEDLDGDTRYEKFSKSISALPSNSEIERKKISTD